METFVSTFGRNVYQRTIIIFTHVDDAKYDERDIYAEIENSYFHEFVKKCENRIFLLNNKESNQNKREEEAEKMVLEMSRIGQQHGTYTRPTSQKRHCKLITIGAFVFVIIVIVVVVITTHGK